MLRNALVLSAGGMKCIYQMGAIAALREAGIEFDLIVGCSGGALNASLLAMDDWDGLKLLWKRVIDEGPQVIYTSEYMEEGATSPKLSFSKVWRKISPRLSPKVLWKMLSERGRLSLLGDGVDQINGIPALADNTPLLDLLTTRIRRDKFKSAFICGAVSMNTGEYHAKGPADFDSDEELARFIRASASMPLIWPATPTVNLRENVQINQLVDGGLRTISPLGDALRYIADTDEPEEWRIWIINCTGDAISQETGVESIPLMKMATRCLDVLLADIFENDLQRYFDVNAIVRQAKLAGFTPLNRNGKPLRAFETVVIQPSGEQLGSTLDSSPDVLCQRQLLGYEHGLTALMKLDATYS